MKKKKKMSSLIFEPTHGFEKQMRSLRIIGTERLHVPMNRWHLVEAVTSLVLNGPLISRGNGDTMLAFISMNNNSKFSLDCVKACGVNKLPVKPPVRTGGRGEGARAKLGMALLGPDGAHASMSGH